MKQVCVMCGEEGSFKRQDDFYDGGWNALQLGGRRKHYFCPKHTSKDMVAFLMFRDIGDSVSPAHAKLLKQRAEGYIGERGGRVQVMKRRMGIDYTSCDGCGKQFHERELAYISTKERVCIKCEENNGG